MPGRVFTSSVSLVLPTTRSGLPMISIDPKSILSGGESNILGVCKIRCTPYQKYSKDRAS